MDEGEANEGKVIVSSDSYLKFGNAAKLAIRPDDLHII